MTAGSQPRKATGQSLVEMALVLPLVMLMIFGVLDLGRAVYSYNTLAEAARQANRVAIVNQNLDAIRAEAAAYSPALSIEDAVVCFKQADTLLRDCSNPSADACDPPNFGCLALVTTSMTYQPITPLINVIVPSIDLSSTSIGPVENLAQ